MKNQLQSPSQVFRFSYEHDVCIIEFENKNAAFNCFTVPILKDLKENLAKIVEDESLQGLVFISAKPNCFAAGVDISIFETLKTQEDAQNASQELHAVFEYFAQAPFVTVAAIQGVCLGGGLELALACDYRVCASDSATQLGLPEVNLGLLPGGGGSQRLPRLVGLKTALDLILTGKKIDGKKAKKYGLVDACVPKNQLLQQALSVCYEKKHAKRYGSLGLMAVVQPRPFADSVLEDNVLGRYLIQSQTKRMIQKNTKGHYPAPFLALKAIMEGIQQPLHKALAAEARYFGELAVSPQSKALQHVFHVMTAAKKNPYTLAEQECGASFVDPILCGGNSVAVLGAGLMGSGVATVLADKNVRTVFFDKDAASLQKGLASIHDFFEDRLKKQRLKRFEREAKCSSVFPSLSADYLKNSRIVIEAVYEDCAVKKSVLTMCEKALPGGEFIFATNTSSIPISDIAQDAKNPQHVVGMHFFSPVPKMPLVEIVITPQTLPAVTSAIFDLAIHMGKTPLVVKDGPGFFTTRILAFQIAEALALLSEGALIEDIDGALQDFGMPVGPLTLLDEVGIDVGHHIVQVLKKAFGDRLVLAPEIEAIRTEKRCGRKNSLGFYRYENGLKTKPDQTIYRHFPKKRVSFTHQDIVDRCVFVFLNEAAHCLDEGILRSAADGDLGALFGLGFPPFLGGPFYYADTLGRNHVKRKLKELVVRHGPRFEPAAYWSS